MISPMIPVPASVVSSLVRCPSPVSHWRSTSQRLTSHYCLPSSTGPRVWYLHPTLIDALTLQALPLSLCTTTMANVDDWLKTVPLVLPVSLHNDLTMANIDDWLEPFLWSRFYCPLALSAVRA